MLTFAAFQRRCSQRPKAHSDMKPRKRGTSQQLLRLHVFGLALSGVFWLCQVVFWSCQVVFWPCQVVFWLCQVVFWPRQVVFWLGWPSPLFKLYTNFVCLFSSLQPCRMNINPTKGLYHYTSLLTTLKSHSLCNTEAIQHFRLRYWHAFCRSRYPVFFSGLELFHIDIVRVSRVSLLSGTQPAILVSL